MSANKPSSQPHDSSKGKQPGVTSSKSRDPKQALAYWTDDVVNRARPVPRPEPESPVDEGSESGDEDAKDDK